ncbi:hypothetical protein M885DRAFT_584779 [Pelagophyceae sp. CCMP2097]|nr:hypothetical protein M885DRAFT_584779 [Pelagophyceae sp. CCMP2097]
MEYDKPDDVLLAPNKFKSVATNVVTSEWKPKAVLLPPTVDEIFEVYSQLDVDASGRVSCRELERFLAGDDLHHTFIVEFSTADIGITWKDGLDGSVVVSTIERGSPAHDAEDVIPGLALARVDGAFPPEGGAAALTKGWPQLVGLRGKTRIEFYEPFCITHEFAKDLDFEVYKRKTGILEPESPGGKLPVLRNSSFSKNKSPVDTGGWGAQLAEKRATRIFTATLPSLAFATAEALALRLCEALQDAAPFIFGEGCVDQISGVITLRSEQPFRLVTSGGPSKDTSMHRVLGLRGCEKSDDEGMAFELVGESKLQTSMRLGFKTSQQVRTFTAELLPKYDSNLNGSLEFDEFRVLYVTRLFFPQDRAVLRQQVKERFRTDAEKQRLADAAAAALRREAFKLDLKEKRACNKLIVENQKCLLKSGATTFVDCDGTIRRIRGVTATVTLEGRKERKAAEKAFKADQLLLAAQSPSGREAAWRETVMREAVRRDAARGDPLRRSGDGSQSGDVVAQTAALHASGDRGTRVDGTSSETDLARAGLALGRSGRRPSDSLLRKRGRALQVAAWRHKKADARQAAVDSAEAAFSAGRRAAEAKQKQAVVSLRGRSYENAAAPLGEATARPVFTLEDHAAPHPAFQGRAFKRTAWATASSPVFSGLVRHPAAVAEAPSARDLLRAVDDLKHLDQPCRWRNVPAPPLCHGVARARFRAVTQAYDNAEIAHPATWGCVLAPAAGGFSDDVRTSAPALQGYALERQAALRREKKGSAARAAKFLSPVRRLQRGGGCLDADAGYKAGYDDDAEACHICLGGGGGCPWCFEFAEGTRASDFAFSLVSDASPAPTKKIHTDLTTRSSVVHHRHARDKLARALIKSMPCGQVTSLTLNCDMPVGHVHHLLRSNSATGNDPYAFMCIPTERGLVSFECVDDAAARIVDVLTTPDPAAVPLSRYGFTQGAKAVLFHGFDKEIMWSLVSSFANCNLDLSRPDRANDVVRHLDYVPPSLPGHDAVQRALWDLFLVQENTHKQYVIDDLNAEVESVRAEAQAHMDETRAAALESRRAGRARTGDVGHNRRQANRDRLHSMLRRIADGEFDQAEAEADTAVEVDDESN